MIKKLRYKFIGYLTGAVFVLLLLVLGLTNIINFGKVTSEADDLTLVLLNNQGGFPGDFNGQGNQSSSASSASASKAAVMEPGDGQMPPDMSKETPYDTRYFVVEFNNNNEIVRVDTSHIASVSQDEAKSIASSNLGHETGYYNDFRYRVGYPKGDTTKNRLAIYVDYSRQLNPGKTFLITSIIVLAAGTLVTFGIAVLVSKRLVKPIEDSQKSQKRFISDASHQMKTPLTIISANDEIIEMEHGESESTRIIAKEVDILTKMVRSLNTLAVLDEGGKLEKTDFDLSSLVSEQAGIFQKSLKEKGFDAKIQDGIVYNGNQANIHELVEIILDNARKYAKSKISLSLEKVEDRIVLIERNDTAGFEDGIHDEVFGRFYRSDDARVAVSDGSGIGLSIAKEIVLAHGGRIYCYGENNDFILKVQL